MSENKQPLRENILFDPESIWLKVCLILMFLLAALIRRDEIKAPGHLVDREYTSAIFARAFYYADNDNVESWEKNVAITTKNQQPILEPPLLEYLVSLIYRVVGQEEMSFGRYLTNLFWLIGGAFMFKIAQKLLSTDSAVFATAYYLFVPMGVIISRSFQPDSLMMMMFLISLYSIILYFENSSTNRLLLSSILAGTTLLLRPLVLFALLCSFLVMSIHKKKSWGAIFDAPFLTFSGISLLIPALYYGYGILIAGFMRWKVATSFLPHLLIKWDFWRGWFEVGVGVAVHSFLVVAILEFFFLPRNLTRALIIGLTISYLLFGVTFTYHIHTHPYYHIQLFPIIGICAAPFFVRITLALKNLPGKSWLAPILTIMLIVLYFSYREVRQSLYIKGFENPNIASEIGDLIGHSSQTVFVAYYYGLPLEYYGQFSGAPWPVSIDDPFYRSPDEKERSVEERIDSLGFIPEYFVITNFDLYNQQHQDLKVYLEENCSVTAQTDQYLIYGSCHIPTAMENPD